MTLKTIAVVSALVLATGLIGAGAGIMASPRGTVLAQGLPKSAAQGELLQINQHEVGVRQPAVDAFGDPLPVGALARVGSVRWRQENGITASALSPDGKRLVTSSDWSVVVWDLTTGKVLWKPPTIDGAYYSRPSLCISPDGKYVAYVQYDTHVLVWDLETGKEIRAAISGEGALQRHLSLSVHGGRQGVCAR